MGGGAALWGGGPSSGPTAASPSVPQFPPPQPPPFGSPYGSGLGGHPLSPAAPHPCLGPRRAERSSSFLQTQEKGGEERMENMENMENMESSPEGPDPKEPRGPEPHSPKEPHSSDPPGAEEEEEVEEEEEEEEDAELLGGFEKELGGVLLPREQMAQLKEEVKTEMEKEFDSIISEVGAGGTRPPHRHPLTPPQRPRWHPLTPPH